MIRFLRLWLAFIASFCAQVLWAAGADNETLVITGDLWCPVNCAPDGQQPGIFVELVQDIFAERGIEVEYRVTNWARAVHEVRLGKANALLGAGVRDAPDFIFTKTAVGISRNCFYAKPGPGWRYQGVDSLARVTVGAINGYSYGQELNTYFERYRADSARVQMASGDRALALNIDKLRKGRVDTIIENNWVMQAYLARQGQTDALLEVGCRKIDVPIYVAFSPALGASQRYVDIFEQGLERYAATGKVAALYRRYGISPPAIDPDHSSPAPDPQR
ncbi:substrate-binding periplasmic protein [Pseudomonas sp. S9]|uniref:substrate-binding periplasmic protein n=1 Tax=Pseudomonas sp. S9 TaxID=686578 RepID=UPI00025572BB|nr:transporter substrate-binding domain-containing protein [Pseudomonas sp. S9]